MFAALCQALVQTVITVHLCFGRINKVREEFAEEIDFWSRRFIPAAFFFALMVVYALEPVDPYSISSTDGQVSEEDVLRSPRMYKGLCVVLGSNPRQCDCPCVRCCLAS